MGDFLMIKGCCIGPKKRALTLRKSLLTTPRRGLLRSLTSSLSTPPPSSVTEDSRPTPRRPPSDFIKPYNNNSIPNARDCSREGANFEEGEFCRFPIASIGDCAKGKHGFDSNSPCLILKLNRIYGLVPDF